MALKTSQLISILQLPLLGRVSAFALARYSIEHDINLETTEELLSYLDKCKELKIVKRLPEYNLKDLNSAVYKAETIINRSEEVGIKIITYFDNMFPNKLKGITSNGKDVSPLILYFKGNINIASTKGIAIIGTREPTPEGITTGFYLGKKYAELGYNIISGLAKGCDTAAHNGAIAAKGLSTAVLAHGLDSVYPFENKMLASKILEYGGLLISEYTLGTNPLPNYFIERDRLQAGLADATIVIQTACKGGTMHAVRATKENNKPLFVVDYKNNTTILDSKISGNKMLINDGAYTLTSDKLESLVKVINENSGKVKINDLFNSI